MDNIRHFLGKLKTAKVREGYQMVLFKLNRYFLMFYLMKQVEFYIISIHIIPIFQRILLRVFNINYQKNESYVATIC